MAVRRFSVSAKSKGRMRVTVETLIVTEPGALMLDELERMKAEIADRLMKVLDETPYLNVHLSQIKVSR